MGTPSEKIDLSKVADAINVNVVEPLLDDEEPSDNEETKEFPSDEELAAAIKTKSALVGPILNEFFRHAAEGTDYWLKKKSLRILAEWIMSLQNVATIMEQQLEALSSVVRAQEAELEELRPKKKVIWTPFG